MVKSISILFFILFLMQFAYSQHYEITYDEVINNPNVGKSTFESHLFIDSKKSYYYKNKSTLKSNPNAQVIELKGKSPVYFKKDFSKKEIVYSQSITNNSFIIRESIPLQRWELQKETKKIGDYLCKKAKTNFRGREYTAWFTEELPIIGGPWKFDGLSGIILEVASSDGYFSITSRTISYKQTVLPSPPLEINENTAITWEAFCSKYNDSIRKWEKIMAAKAEPGDEFKMTISTIEDMGIKDGRVTK